MSALPNGWIAASLEEVAQVNPRLDKSEIDADLEVSFVPMPAVEAESGKIDVSAKRRFSEVEKGYTGFKENDVLFAKITPCMENGKMAVVPEVHGGLGFGSTEFHVLRPPAGIVPKYLYYFVSSKSFRMNAEHNMTGAVGQRRVPTTYFSQADIPLPPSAEQRRIVGKIEALFSELDAGVANLKQARAQLAVYRQALLKHAFEGHLTAIKGIKKVPLSSLITDLSQGWSPKCELNRAPKPDEWAVIKTTAIQHCRYDDTEAKPLPPPFEGRPSIEIKDGDFLMTRKGPRTRAGVSCYVRRTRHRLMVCDTVYRFRCIEDRVTPLYLELALNSPDVLRAIDQRKAGISESGLSLTHSKIGTVEIPLCSLDEQQDIVRQLDEQTSVMDALEADIDLNLQKAEALRQSILKKAFAGELVPQDPADEPAAALLARIRAEREAATARPKAKQAGKRPAKLT